MNKIGVTTNSNYACPTLLSPDGLILISEGIADLSTQLTILKRIEDVAEPALTDDETALWWDTNLTQMWLIHRRSGVQYKIQLP